MTRKALILSVGVISLIAGAGQAATITLTTSGNWNTGSNWDLNRVPTDGDHVVIPSNKAVDIDINNAIADSVELSGTMTFQSNCQLTVDDGLFNVKPGALVHLNHGGAVLILEAPDALDVDPASGIGAQPGRVRIDASNTVVRLSGASSSGNPIDGEVWLQNASAKLDITANVTVTGGGEIESTSATAQIAIANGSTFTSTMAAASGAIRGYMQVAGTGSFVNNGLVFAGTGGTFELVNSLAAVSGSGDWQVASSGTRQLLFSKGGTTFSGDFILAGEMEAGENVTTTGQLTFNTGALIDVDTAGTTFQYQTFNGSSSCGNPGTGSGPYVVSSNASCP